MSPMMLVLMLGKIGLGYRNMVLEGGTINEKTSKVPSLRAQII